MYSESCFENVFETNPIKVRDYLLIKPDMLWACDVGLIADYLPLLPNVPTRFVRDPPPGLQKLQEVNDAAQFTCVSFNWQHEHVHAQVQAQAQAQG